MLEIGQQTRTQAPPPHIVYDALLRPSRDEPRNWLSLVDDEIAPRILESEKPSLVVWSSLWPDRSEDVVRFEIEPDNSGSRLTWRLLSPDDQPEAGRLGWMRYRLNFLINGQLRFSFGQ
jgi:hypothetical protein